MGIEHYRFISRLENWKTNIFEDKRGNQNGIPLETKQIIYNEWLCNSIPSVIHGRELVRMRKLLYLKKFEGIVNNPPLNEIVNKRGIKMYEATRQLVTCTVRQLQSTLKEKYDIIASLGMIINFKPFYMCYANEKERIMCMCGTCLNAHLLFNVIRNNCPEIKTTSVSEYFMLKMLKIREWFLAV